MKNKTKLIGSAGSLEVLLKVVTQYFYSDITFEQQGAGIWSIYNSNGKINNFRIVQKKLRYRFELELNNEN